MPSSEKRPAGDDFGNAQLIVKRQNVGAVTSLPQRNGPGALVKGVARSSGLKAPVMELSGHKSEVFSAKFDPTGNLIASGSMDRSILLWRTYGECENYGILTGHKGAVLDLQWSRDSSTVFSASADNQLASWNLETGQRIRRYCGHEGIVNALDLSKRGQELIVSGSDDGSIGLWDPRQKTCVDYIQTNYPVTAVALSPTGEELFFGSIDNDIWAYSLTRKAVAYSLLGHHDTITSLRISPDGRSILSFAMDSTARTWDIQSYAPGSRHIRTFDGAAMGLERNLVKASWDKTGRKVASGAGDGTVVIWSTDTGKIAYKLPGHKGVVNCAELSPGAEPLILSASSDRTLILGELK